MARIKPKPWRNNTQYLFSKKRNIRYCRNNFFAKTFNKEPWSYKSSSIFVEFNSPCNLIEKLLGDSPVLNVLRKLFTEFSLSLLFINIEILLLYPATILFFIDIAVLKSTFSWDRFHEDQKSHSHQIISYSQYYLIKNRHFIMFNIPISIKNISINMKALWDQAQFPL
jgi:hypothetical protein